MNELESAIKLAFDADGSQLEANKAYLEFIKANFIIPIEKHSVESEPIVLFFTADGITFLPVFSNMDFFKNWSKEIQDNIQVLKLSGVDLLKGIGDNVTVSLNIGSELYKEFNSMEIGRMKNIVLKLFKD